MLSGWLTETEELCVVFVNFMRKEKFRQFCQRLVAMRQLSGMDRVRRGSALMVDGGGFLSDV